VAQGLGRNSIAIEINSEYYSLLTENSDQIRLLEGRSAYEPD
jgi:DNA modification methylase